jgi:hypothetical protein
VANKAKGREGFPEDPQPYQVHNKDGKKYVWYPSLDDWVEDEDPPNPPTARQTSRVVVSRRPPDVEAGL